MCAYSNKLKNVMSNYQGGRWGDHKQMLLSEKGAKVSVSYEDMIVLCDFLSLDLLSYLGLAIRRGVCNNGLPLHPLKTYRQRLIICCIC